MSSSKFNRGGYPSGGGSQFDSQQTLKLGFDDNLQSHRFHDSEAPVYDRFETVIDADGNMTLITYYKGVNHEKFELGINEDASTLNNKYFLISSAYDRVKLYVWYNVDGLGTDPNIAGATGIEIPLVAGDTTQIVTTATNGFLKTNPLFNYLFEVTKKNGVLEFYTKKEGPVTTNSGGTTNFILNTLEDGTELVSDIYSITYDANCNITGMYKV